MGSLAESAPTGRDPRVVGPSAVTVLEYHAMLEHGILKSGDPVELIDGFLVIPIARNPRHDAAKDLFRVAMSPFVPSWMMLRSQRAVSLLDSEPEPDFAVVIGGPRSFATHHPRPTEIVLVVEVSDSSLSIDRTLKSAMYARNGLRQYWIINLPELRVEVFSVPQQTSHPHAFETVIAYGVGQSVPVVLDGQTVALIPVSDLLP